jgi:hypothetical protein
MPATSILVSLLAASLAFASPIEQRATSSIDQAFKADGKKYWGTCADSNTLGISQNAAIIKADFGQLTPENSMKWSVLVQRHTGLMLTFTGMQRSPIAANSATAAAMLSSASLRATASSSADIRSFGIRSCRVRIQPTSRRAMR